MEVRAVPVDELHPAPWNPRTITDERFQNLCRSMQADPEFLWRRPVLAMADGTIYAGNMRYRAAVHLGYRAIPAIVEDVPEQLAKERAVRDNAQWGDWEDAGLAAMLAGLEADGADLDLIGIPEAELEWMLGLAASPPGAGGEPSSPRRLGNDPALFRVLLSPVGVELLERALAATGLMNRAEAMAHILEAYIASTGGQLDVPPESAAAEAHPPGPPAATGRARNTRRHGGAV